MKEVASKLEKINKNATKNFFETVTMSSIRVTPLGAGQDVGRSCLLVSMGGKHIMLDCGMHMGYNDDRRFPDFSYVTPGAVGPTVNPQPGQGGPQGPPPPPPPEPGDNLTDHIDMVIISHFHLVRRTVPTCACENDL